MHMSSNRVVVLLTDGELEDVRRRAGLVPLSAWFRSLAFPVGVSVRIASEGRVQRVMGEEAPRHLDAVSENRGKATVETWTRQPLLKPSEKGKK